MGATVADVFVPEEDVRIELLKGQNLPRSSRVRLADQTEEWLEEFVEDFIGIAKDHHVPWARRAAEQ
eukprot:7745955-Karenia_brevis.AAC.1